MAGVARLTRWPNAVLQTATHRWRYLWLPANPGGPAIGLFDDFAGADRSRPPLALRYNPRYTAEIPAISRRLSDAGIAHERDRRSGTLSVPLAIPPGASHHDMVLVLVS